MKQTKTVQWSTMNERQLKMVAAAEEMMKGKGKEQSDEAKEKG